MPAPQSRPLTVAIVGATGAVGVELMRCLEQRAFPLDQLKLLASARSAGKILDFKGAQVAVEELTEASFNGVDIALFSAGAPGFNARFISDNAAARSEKDCSPGWQSTTSNIPPRPSAHP